MRNKASATHISSTPSSDDRSYWRMNRSTTVWSWALARTRNTSSLARVSTNSRSAAVRLARAMSSPTSADSSMA